MRRRIAAALASVGAGLLALTAVVPTTAAWTDSVHVSAESSSSTWAAPPVNNPGDVVSPGDSTTLEDVAWTSPPNPNSQVCTTISVRGQSATPAPWSVTLNLAGAPFFGASFLYYTGATQVAFQYSPGSATVTGVGTGSPWNPSYSNSTLTSAQTLTFTICGQPAGAPTVQDASWRSVSQVMQGTWTPTLACVAMTVTGTVDPVAYPFFFGWQANLDLTGAKQHIVNSGRTVNYVSWNPAPSGGYQFSTDPAATNPVADVYAITSGTMTALRGTSSQTITACVYGY